MFPVHTDLPHRPIARLIRPAAFVLFVLVSTLTASAQPVTLPIVEKPHQHEAAQYGYHPWYIPNVPVFDRYNRPYLRSRATDPHTTGYIQTLRNGRWVRRDFTHAITQEFPAFDRFRHAGGTLGAGITFDADDALYTLVRIHLTDNTERDLLLYSPDYGDSFQVLALPTDHDPKATPIGSANMEQRVGYNTLTRPPLIAALAKRSNNPLGQWTANYNVFLIQPRKDHGKLVLSEPVLLTDHGLYMTRQTGNPSFAVSAEDKTYVTWAETTDHIWYPGTPNFVATFDPQTLEISGRQMFGYCRPLNDGHNSPGIVLDKEGYIHAISGAHGESFIYSRSNKPYSTADGMTLAQPMLRTGWKEFGAERGRQTYLSFVAGQGGSLHTVFRQWYYQTLPYFSDLYDKPGPEPYNGYFGSLSYMRKMTDEPWPERSTVMVVPPVSGYSIHYQNLAVDRDLRLYLSYSYRTPDPAYGTGEAENHYMALLMSPDNGDSWRLMTTEDFARNVNAAVAHDAKLSPASLTVTVVDPHAKPIAGAKVTLANSQFTTDPAGRLTIHGVLHDQPDLSVAADGYAPHRQVVKFDGKNSLELQIQLKTLSD